METSKQISMTQNIRIKKEEIQVKEELIGDHYADLNINKKCRIDECPHFENQKKNAINVDAALIQELYEGPELLDMLQMTRNDHMDLGANFFCEFCNKTFFKKQQLENHLKIHKNIRNFACDFCTKRFIHKQQLQNHVKTHTGEKNFACKVCSKKFIHKQQLDNHVKTHTGEKNFECETCNKKFTLKQQLQNHAKIHLGIKPFSCELCDKRFTLKQHLTNHTKTHLGLKDFVCSQCSKSFITKQQHAAHLKTHEKPPIRVDYTIQDLKGVKQAEKIFH